MPQLMAEAFARDLVDKIMVETFDILESIMQQDNSPVEIGSAEISSQSVHSRLQMHVDCDEENANEEPVERDVKIGEPSSALCSLTILEEQVKRTARSIHDALLSNTIETTETYVIQGQGDVDQIICDAVIETRTQSIEPINTKGKESHSVNEAANASTNLLHHMIKELETNLNDAVLEQASNPESIVEETSASDREYRKTEGSLVRSVENAKNLEQISSAIPAEVESMIHAENVDIEKPKKPSLLLASTSFAKNISLEEVAIKESQSSSSSPSTMRKNVASATLAFTSEQDIRDAASSSELKLPSKESGKKPGFLSRMRKALRVTFGRRKN